MAKLNAPLYDGQSFTWKGDTGYVDASDLSGGAFMSRLYDDAADLGFYIRSQRTGQVLMFHCCKGLYHAGEFVGWEFQSSRFKVIVAND